MNKPGIRAKLAMAFVIVSAMTAAGMLLFVQWSFERGFTKYINSQSQKDLKAFSSVVMDYYSPPNAEQEGGWPRLTRQPHIWRELLLYFQSGRDSSLRSPVQSPPQTPPFQTPPDAGQRGEPGFFPGRPPGPPPQPLDGPKVMLLDTARHVLLGPELADGQVSYLPLEYHGKVVGYLGLLQEKFVADRLDLGFLDSQRRSFILIALLMLVPALVLSLPLARRLVKPLRQLIQGTRQLSSGHYDTRIHVDNQDEIGELAEHFNHLARTLEANDSDRKQWVADISHELRTPLSVLKAQIEALQDGIHQPSAKHLQMLHDRVGQLTGLVEDLYELSLTDLGALSYHPEKLSLKGFIEDLVDSYSDVFAGSQLDIRVELDLADADGIFADEKRMRQLLSNLLKNSVRYTDAGGVIRIRAFVNDTSGVNILIEDSAPGVPEDKLGRIFDRLYRVDRSRSRAHGGAGLGLSICRNIVLAHDGKIEAGPSALGGLKVQIQLPLKR